MTVKKNVLAVCLIDETGSMNYIRDRTMSCFNEYIEGLLPHGKGCHMTLAKFNSMRTEIMCSNVPIKDVPKLTVNNYTPQASTPLYDAVCLTIKNTEEQITILKDNPDVLFIVFTDGEENDSRQFNRQQVVDMIKEKESKGWTMVYLGANQDAWNNASGMGYGKVGTVATYVASDAGVLDGLANTFASTKRYFSRREAAYGGMSASQILVSNFSDSSFLTTSDPAIGDNICEVSNYHSDIQEFKEKVLKKGVKKHAKSK
jgi:hypothetical protein